MNVLDWQLLSSVRLCRRLHWSRWLLLPRTSFRTCRFPLKVADVRSRLNWKPNNSIVVWSLSWLPQPPKSNLFVCFREEQDFQLCAAASELRQNGAWWPLHINLEWFDSTTRTRDYHWSLTSQRATHKEAKMTWCHTLDSSQWRRIILVSGHLAL